MRVEDILFLHPIFFCVRLKYFLKSIHRNCHVQNKEKKTTSKLRYLCKFFCFCTRAQNTYVRLHDSQKETSRSENRKFSCAPCKFWKKNLLNLIPCRHFD